MKVSRIRRQTAAAESEAVSLKRLDHIRNMKLRVLTQLTSINSGCTIRVIAVVHWLECPGEG
jgi:hypothetical protein